ncbi:MAG: riboflavin synthase subunit alpha [Pseudomonadales bacterium]
MFTGIVQAQCSVTRVEDQPSLRRLWVDLGELADNLEGGASVAHNGVCLTVAGQQGSIVQFDVIAETLDRTNLGTLGAGDLVNIERSFRVGDEVGGHIVSGHVAASVAVARIDQSDNLRVVYFTVPSEWMKYLHLKGFVALDGASLTISHCDQQACEIGVSLIPETIERTSLGRCEVGEYVNLEVDAQTQAVVETVERVLGSDRYAHLLAPG